LIFGVPISILIPVVRKRLADFGREDDKGATVGPDEDGSDNNGLGDAGGFDDDGGFGSGGFSTGDGRAFQTEGRSLDGGDADNSLLDNDVIHEDQLRKIDDYFNYMEVGGIYSASSVINVDTCQQSIR
jgi:hypothetical protein